MNLNALELPDAGYAPQFELVHADLLRFFPDLVRELGGDPDLVMRRAGTQPQALSSGLSYRSWVHLLEQAAAHLHCADFGMRLARLQGGGQVFGPMGLVMKHSKTLGEAIEYVARHAHVHSLASDIRLVRDDAQGTVFVSHEILVDGLPNKRQAIEQALLLAHLNAAEITGGLARVREVRFRHRPLSSRFTYRRCFGAPVRFDEQEDGVVFSQQDLCCPIVDRNEEVYALATSFIESRFAQIAQPLHARVRALIVRCIETADCSIERICAELQLHPRTLHRRLKTEGRSFEGVKDEVRRDVALRYLQESDHSLSFIAEKLGYAEQSVLTRSCIRWFSARPSQLRARAAS